MQTRDVLRCFIKFPSGGQGVGLLLLRLNVAASLMFTASRQLSSLDLVEAMVPAILLCLGFLTPLAAALCALHEVMAMVTAGRGDLTFMSVTTVNAIAVLLLGPGGFSLDARLFGRRVVILPKLEPPERD